MLIKSFTNFFPKSFIRNKIKDFDVITPSYHNYFRLYTKGVYSPPPTAEILFESMKGNPHEKLNSPKAGWRTAGKLPS